jgi:biotin transporter BioY
VILVAAGGGLAILTGPTAGYLFGFLIVAGSVGHLASRDLDDPISFSQKTSFARGQAQLKRSP